MLRERERERGREREGATHAACVVVSTAAFAVDSQVAAAAVAGRGSGGVGGFTRGGGFTGVDIYNGGGGNCFNPFPAPGDGRTPPTRLSL